MDADMFVGWNIATSELTDGSNVYDVVGWAGNVRLVFRCKNEKQAKRLLAEFSDIICFGEVV